MKYFKKITLVVSFTLLCHSSWAQQDKIKNIANKKVGRLLSITGKAKLDNRAINTFGQELYLGSTIETMNGHLSILIGIDQLIELDQKTKIRIIPLQEVQANRSFVDFAVMLDYGKLRVIKGESEKKDEFSYFPISTSSGFFHLNTGRYLIEPKRFVSLDNTSEFSKTNLRQLKANYDTQSELFFSNVDVDGGESVIGENNDVQYFPDTSLDANQKLIALLMPVASLYDFKTQYMKKVNWDNLLAKFNSSTGSIDSVDISKRKQNKCVKELPVKATPQVIEMKGQKIVVEAGQELKIDGQLEISKLSKEELESEFANLPEMKISKCEEKIEEIFEEAPPEIVEIKSLSKRLSEPQKPGSVFGLPGSNVDETNQSYNLTIRVQL